MKTLKVYGDRASTPFAIGDFSEPYLSIVHALRSAQAGSRQMDALVKLRGQLGSNTAQHAKADHLTQGQLSLSTMVLGAAMVRQLATSLCARGMQSTGTESTRTVSRRSSLNLKRTNCLRKGWKSSAM